MNARYILLFFLLFIFAQAGYAQAPVEFVQNKGQWGDWFAYKATMKGGDVCLEKSGFRYILCDKDNNNKIDLFHHAQTRERPILKFHEYTATFVNADIPEITGERPMQVYYNYFIGNDSSQWKSGIHPDRGVNYKGLYKGIDMHITSEKGNVVYDFIVQPQADAAGIKLKFEGQDNIQIQNNNLLVSTSVGDVKEMQPSAYQYINNVRVDVPCNYSLNSNILSFNFPNGYDHSATLFIDPTVVFCTLSGSTADNWGFTATYDDAGNFYAGGIVNALSYAGGGHFPVSPGAFQTTFGGGYGTIANVDSTYACDISIIKYDPTGVNRIYATYLGGSDNERPHSMIVDANNDLIVAGRSKSTNFPTTPGAFSTTNSGGWDIIITKFNPTGTALIGSTYIGGSADDGVNFDSTEWGFGQLKYNYGDDARSEVQVDNAGNIYVGGCTWSTNFPITPATAISTTLSGTQDGVVIKLNSTLTTLLWGTYIGGNGSDAGYVLAFDTAQSSLYVAGGTNSTNFPTTAGVLHTTFQGGRADGFILKFKNSAPYNLQAGTYVGTSNYDQIYGIQVSGDNYVYVMGQSLGGTFPVTSGVYSNPNSCQFIMKTDSNLASDLISTVYGNGDQDSTNISPVAFLVDTCGNVYVSGWGGDLGITSGSEATGTAVNMPTTPGAIRTASPLGRDFYFIVLGPGMTNLVYATYYGRTCPLASQIWEGAHVDGGTSRFDKHGIIYQAMCADCGGAPGSNSNACAAPYPTTTGVWSMIDSSTNCNEAALKIAFNIAPVSAAVSAAPSTQGCAPLTVNFTNTSVSALSYVWNFGDGSPTVTSYNASHTFTAGGVYTVSLAAANSNACFRTNDTAYLIVIVDTTIIHPAFTYTVTNSCGPYTVAITNTSTDNAGTPTYQWWLGDGTTYTGTTPPVHTYPDSGTYNIMLVMTDTAACNSPDTVIQTISINSFRVAASFSMPDSVCEYTSVTPTGGPVNATSFTWSFGTGQTSTSNPATVMYDTVGTFTVTLIAQNPGACNGADTFTESIKVLPVPTAAFTFDPTTPQPNIPTTFNNESVNATRYLWAFGDNTTSVEVNPTHQYDKTGNYTVCLTAYNNSNCPSIACRTITADIEPLVGLPSAFSPNGDGSNDVLYVRGAAISTLDLKIFNRWGQLVFETTSQQIGWDGTFNGQPQPIDAYAYVLHVSFIDGSEKLLKGNITLLR